VRKEYVSRETLDANNYKKKKSPEGILFIAGKKKRRRKEVDSWRDGEKGGGGETRKPIGGLA